MTTMSLKLPMALHESLIRAAKDRKVSKSELVRTVLQENLMREFANPSDTPSAALAWVQRWSGKFSAALVQNAIDGGTPLLGSPADSRLQHIIDKHLR